MSDLSHYQTPPSPARELEPIVVVLAEDEKETVSRHIFPSLNIDIQRDYAELYNIPNASSLPSEEIFRLLLSKNSTIPLHPKHVLIDGDLGQQIVRREDVEPQQLEQDEAEVPSSSTEDAAPKDRLPTPDDGGSGREAIPQDESSVAPSLATHSTQRDQHHDLQTRMHQTNLEASALFKAQETQLQEILTSVKNIVGPQIAKWIDENVAASVKAGKLVLSDLPVLGNRPDDGLSGPRRGDEGHDEASGRTNSDRKGKGKEKDSDQSHGPKDSTNNDKTSGNTKPSGPLTRSNRKRSAESQPDENTGRLKRSKISPARAAPSPVPEKSSPSLKRVREEVEDSDDGSEDEVEKSVIMHRSFSSIFEGLSPASKKARRQGSHVHDTVDITSSSLPSGSSTSPGTKSHGPSSQTGPTDNHAEPSTSSHPTTSRLFPPSAFPRVRPPAPPQRPREATAKPLKRDTMRMRTNPDTGEPEVFNYEESREYRVRLQRDRYSALLDPLSDFNVDFQIMSELDGPHFRFDRDAWRSFEDHTLMS